MKTISRERAANLIANSGGLIFAASVIKRTDETPRRLVCRMYRRKDARAEVDARNAQFTVIDMERSRQLGARQFRTVAVDRLQRLVINHNSYEVTP